MGAGGGWGGGLGVNLLLCLWGKRGGVVLCRLRFWIERFGRVEMDGRLQGWKGGETGEGVSVCGKGDEFPEKREGGNGAASSALYRLNRAWLGGLCR